MLFVGVFRNSRISFCPFDALFLHPLSTAKASDDARRTLDHNKAFLLLDASVFTSVPPRSRALSRERERERKRSHHSFSHTDLFCDLNAKALEFRASFSTHTGCFCPKKKRRSSSLNARKFSRVLKHFFARFENKSERKSVPRESERFSFCWRRPRVWKTRFIKKTF